MRGVILLAAVVAVAVAKPELYKENEEFEYSRSSTDEGSKSGFYGAQRGNMGGNYEKAHNMDDVAQKQMSGLIGQVEGELGDLSKARVGDVYSEAHSRGIYGQGQYDLSNLQGRSFQENANHADLQTHSSSLNSGYNRHSGFDGTAFHGSHFTPSYSGAYGGNNYQRSENLQAGVNSGREYGVESGHHSAYQTKSSGYRASNAAYSGYGGSSLHNRMVGVPAGSPVRISIRPGSTVNVPVAAETYDAGRSSAYTHGAADSDVELIDRTERPIYNYEPRGSSGSRTSKHYESGYKYHKEWEKHETLPAAAPLNIPVPTTGMNSELVDAQHNNYYGNVLDSHSSRKQYSGYKSDTSATKSQYDSTYNTNAQSDAYRNAEALASTLEQKGLNNINTAPKSHQSSYSYHKSWERQGDPYVIVPAGEQSQRLTASNNQGTQYGLKDRQIHQSYSQDDCECDEHGNIRVARSADFQQQEDLTQQTQNDWENLEQQAIGKNERSGKLEEFGQQSQQRWDAQDLTQQTQNSNWDSSRYGHNSYNGKLEDFGQHTQHTLDAEDLTQQTQQNHRERARYGHNTQNNGRLESFDQHGHHNLDAEDQTQQTQQNNWDSSRYGHNSHNNGKLEDFGQQTQDKWNTEDLTQQTQQHNWDMNRYRHHSHGNDRLENFGHHGQQQFGAEDLTQHSSREGSNHYGGHAQNQYGQRGQEHRPGQHDDIVQHTQQRWDAEDNFKQVSQDTQSNVGIRADQINSHTKPILASGNDETQNTFPNRPYNHNTAGDLTQHSETNTYRESRNEDMNTSGSVQSLWNKIDELIQTSMKEEDTNNNFRYQSSTDNVWQKNNESDNYNDRTNIGRGDIGPEPSNVKSSTTLKPYNPQIYTSDNTQNQPRYKTPEEIEALSLSKNKTGHNTNSNSNNTQVRADNIDLRGGNENNFGVLGLNQQSQSGDGQYILDINHKSSAHRSSTSHEQTEYYGQRNTNSWSQGNTHQGIAHNQQQTNNQNLHTNMDGQVQQHLGQETLNMEQQSQTNMGEDLGQVQTSWGQNDQNLEEFNKHQKLKNDFYDELHKHETHQQLELTTATANVQLVSSDSTLGETSTTPKPGFWKSVGNKVGQVASWFKTVKVN